MFNETFSVIFKYCVLGDFLTDISTRNDFRSASINKKSLNLKLVFTVISKGRREMMLYQKEALYDPSSYPLILKMRE